MTTQLPKDRQATGVLLHSQATSIPLTPELLIVFSPLVAAFALVFVLACTNVASMMLARATSRQREIGIRLSLGAVRLRLIRQLFTESLLLSIPAAIFGLIISRLTIDAALWTVYATIPVDMLELVHDVARPVDWRVIGFMIFAGLISAFLFGLAPAIQTTRVSVISSVRGDVELRSQAITCEERARRRADHSLHVVTDCMRRTGPHDHGNECIRYWLLHRSRDCHGSCGQWPQASDRRPVCRSRRRQHSCRFLRPPRRASADSERIFAEWARPSALRSMRSRPLTSKCWEFPWSEAVTSPPWKATSEAPVAILSARAAARFFSGKDALGQTLRVGTPARDVRVIGVAPDIVTCCIPYGKDAALLYLPTNPLKKGSVLVHVRGEVEAERHRLDAHLRVLAPGAINDIHSLDQYRAVGIYAFRAASMIGAAVGGLALLADVDRHLWRRIVLRHSKNKRNRHSCRPRRDHLPGYQPGAEAVHATDCVWCRAWHRSRDSWWRACWPPN